ncbi:MAG: sigma-70 family RNA polymerase sigma factor [Myxococcales bacterium]|nr:sigma-70 family RNA polymerase sigma factor [Myxococcales bacterium]
MLAPKLDPVAGSPAPVHTDPTTADHERFWRLWNEHRADLRERCVRWLRGSSADVEEIMSITALKAVEYLRVHPCSIRNMSPWVSRILHNACVDRLHEHARVVPLGDGGHETSPGSELPRTVETPEHRIHRRELGHSIHRAVDTLPPKLRAAFVLRFVDELSYHEISTRLEITPQNARKRIQKARQRLREDLRRMSPRAR